MRSEAAFVMEHDPKHRYLSKFEKLAEELYKSGDTSVQDDAWKKNRRFLYGYGDAGLTVSLVTRADIQSAIDRAHINVFGEERLVRSERLKIINEDADERNWDVFDLPACRPVSSTHL